MLTFEPFTESDWDAFHGAEDFADGSPPLIACLSGVDALVVHDANGLHVYAGDELGTWYRWCGDAETGKQMLAGVRGESDLVAAGFVRVGSPIPA